MAKEMIVLPYDEAWTELFKQEKELLSGIFGEDILAIHHFGSTSVKGLSAKPVIDIMLVTDDIEKIDPHNSAMEAHGYSARGENGIAGRRYFVKLMPDGSGNHTHHVHVYQKGNPHITDELMFRDFLRLDSSARQEYETVKLEASGKYRFSPKEYTDAKTDCVMGIMKRAREYFGEGIT